MSSKNDNKYFSVKSDRTLSNKIRVFPDGSGSRAFGIFVFLRKSGYLKGKRRSGMRGKLFACLSDLADKLIQLQQIPVSSLISNEPLKDESYMETSERSKDIIKAISKGQKLPPIKVINHPFDHSKHIVVDGNHRMFAFQKLKIQEVNVLTIPYKNVILMKSKWNEPLEQLGTLDKLFKNKGVVDRYFVQPNGTNRFKKVFTK